MICAKCGRPIDPDEEHQINEGTGFHYDVCETCFDSMWERNEIIMCENCSNWYEAKMLRDIGTIGNDTFAPCPLCGHDVVDGMSIMERIQEGA